MLKPPPNAVWIGSSHPFDLHEAYLCFRSPKFDRPTSFGATLYMSADSRYRLWVNGTHVARGPVRCWPHHQSVDRLDLTDYLRTYGNQIAVQVYQPGYSHFAYVHRGAAGLLAWLETEHGETLLQSDTSWRVRRDPSYADEIERVSIYGSGVEDRDLRHDDAWQQAGYPDATWDMARIVSTAADGLWRGLHVPDLPRMIEREQHLRLVETRRGTTEFERDPHLALRAGWMSAQPMSLLPAADEWLHITSDAGESTYLLYDLGRNFTCQAWVDIQGALGREKIAISYAEKFRDGELVLSDPSTYCRVRLTDRYTLRSGGQKVQGFTFRGGRYVLLQIVGPTGPELRIRPHVTVAEYPLEITKPLERDDPVLDAIVDMCETTLRACLQETFVDCCWRESSQWLGDALPQALLMASMTDDLRPLHAALVMAAQGAYPDGLLPSILPGEVHAYAVLDYNFTWVELLALWRQLAGADGQALVDELWPTLIKMLERFHADRADDGLIRSRPGRRLFLDWAPISRNEPNALYNFRYLYALQIAAALGQSIGGDEHEVRRWDERAAALAAHLRSRFFLNGVWFDDVERSTFSQHAAAFALLTGCARAGEVEALLDAIAARSLDPNDDATPDKMVLASPFMHHYLFEALRKFDRQQTIVDIIRLRWGRWVEQGEVTTWENWNVDFPDGSICHAFSAHARVHLAKIADA